MKIYNMDKQEWRDGNFQRGDSWRCNTIYQCQICHTKTNKWVLGGYPGTGPKLICPGDSYSQHDQIEKAFIRYEEVRKKHLEYSRLIQKGGKKKKSFLLNALKEERDLLKEKITKLRKFFRAVDNVKGIPENSPVKDYYPTSRIASQKESLKKAR